MPSASSKRVFKTRTFVRWMKKTELTDAALLIAVEEMEQGLVDADLGGGLFKKRVALPGRGKSGSTRTIVATNRNGRWFFAFGFEKKDKANLTTAELTILRSATQDLIHKTEAQIAQMLATEAIQEIPS